MITNYSKKIGTKIKDKRIEKEMSLRDLAERASVIYGKPISHVSLLRYENEGRSMDIDVLLALCEVLELNFGDFLNECIEEIKKENIKLVKKGNRNKS